ncbi:hypothetical protein BO71DRAFT_331876, partial [Aspergillus ellipticus CBS 707.79]
AHTTTGCGEQGFPSAQPYLSHTPGANPFCCMFLMFFLTVLGSLAGRTCKPELRAIIFTLGIQAACGSPGGRRGYPPDNPVGGLYGKETIL